MNPRNLLFLFPLMLGTLLRPATAQDDRDNITPTRYRVYSGQSFNDIGTTVQGGFRIADIKADDQFGTTFTVTYVENTGAYAKPWAYLVSVDGATLGNFVNQNTVRPTKVICYDGGGGTTLFAAVMEPNTGANARAWWWYSGVSPQQFFNAAVANGARPVSFDEYRIGTTDLSVGVMIANTGADYRPWWFYYNQTFAGVGTLLGQTGARLYALQQNLAGSFNCILVNDAVGPWFYWSGLSSQQLLDTAGNLGLRVYDLQRVNGTFNALMLRNDNDLERRVGNVMRSASDGQVGVYLKRVNGPVLASLQGTRVFEPASTMKTLIHYYAMDQVRLGTSLTSATTVYTGTVGSCPQTTGPITENLNTVLRLMMENSDNNRTQGAELRFGRSNINAMALTLGMASTRIQHTLGCGGPLPNELTLADLGRLHEAVANGALGVQRTNFYDLMLEFPDNYAGSELNNVITQEATATGLTPAQLAAFRSNCRQAFKGGSYLLLGPTREYRSWGSWISLPFYGNTGIEAREYVTGAFVDAASNGTNANTAFNRGAAEVLRDEIHAAMLTWRNHVFGSWTSFGTGCRGSNNVVPSHSGSPAAPSITSALGWSVSGARAATVAAMVFGFSRTVHGSTPLPYEMSSLGMPNCRLYAAIASTSYVTTSATGSATFTATMPNNPALIGTRAYSQFAVFDQGANALGIAWSNAQELLLGGQP